jgi:hypothetical protein
MGTLGKTLPSRSKHRVEDHIGKRYGSRVVLGESPRVSTYLGVLTKCDCGSIKAVGLSHLLAGRHRRCVDCGRTGQTGPDSRSWRGGRYISMTVYEHWHRSAVKRNLDWSITIADLDDLLERQNFQCALSGVLLTIGHGQKNGAVTNGTASLDRIDSKIGYTPDNVQFVRKVINMAKQNYTERDFLEMCRSIVSYADSK